MPSWRVRFDLHVDLNVPAIVGLAAKAEALASVIRRIPIPPHVQRRIDRLNILRAVMGTTGIEGSDLTEAEVRQVLDSQRPGFVLHEARRRMERETLNAAEVMRWVETTLRGDASRPVTEDLIRETHARTTSGIDYAHNQPGRYREHGVSAGEYAAPPHPEIDGLMGEFVRWVNHRERLEWPAAIRAISAHFYLVSIHPFGDGNGRTARAVESYILYQGGINARGFYSLANFYYQNREEYVSLLDACRFNTGGDLTPFIRFALTGLVGELSQVHDEILDAVQLIAFRDYARETLLAAGKLRTRSGERMLSVMLSLGAEAISIAAVRRGSHPLSEYYRMVTPKTFTRDLNWFVAHRLVRVEGDEMRANLEAMLEFMP